MQSITLDRWKYGNNFKQRLKTRHQLINYFNLGAGALPDDIPQITAITEASGKVSGILGQIIDQLCRLGAAGEQSLQRQ
jgi:hypothetical protein